MHTTRMETRAEANQRRTPGEQLEDAGAALRGSLEDVAHAAGELYEVCKDAVTVEDLHDFLAGPIQAWKDAGDAYLTAVRRDALAQGIEEGAR